MSAFRWLNLEVSFPAVSSRGRPALADPEQPIDHPRGLAEKQALNVEVETLTEACLPAGDEAFKALRGRF